MIEVANYNVDTCLEGARLYFDTEKLFEMVDKAEVELRVRAKIEEITRQRKPRVLSEELALQITSNLSVQLLVKRAYIPPDLPDASFSLVIQSQPDDVFHPDGSLAIIRPPPEGFVETPVTRNKKATKDEFKQQLASFKQDTRKLALECNKAARKAGLAKSAVAAFASSSRKYVYPADMHPAKIRFMKAVRKVIINNTVRKITALLDRNERRSMGDIPSPSKTDFRKVMDFDSIITSTSLPSLSALPNVVSKRGSRPHHRLRPVKKGIDGLVLDPNVDSPRLSLPVLEPSRTRGASFDEPIFP